MSVKALQSFIHIGDTEILIDGGDEFPGVVTHLADHVDGPIEMIVATHPHADHIGGLIAVLDAFEVEEIWLRAGKKRQGAARRNSGTSQGAEPNVIRG